jgi:hypothetical protein
MAPHWHPPVMEIVGMREPFSIAVVISSKRRLPLEA